MKKYIIITLCLFQCAIMNAQVWVEGIHNHTFTVYQSTGDHTIRQVGSTPFTKHYYPILKTIDLDLAKPSHEYLGSGICLSDASCYLLSKMPAGQRKRIIKDVFTESGLNLSIVRLNCGASDYATELYTYDETAGDVQMKDFSIDRDRIYMIPVIKQIQKQQPGLFKFSSIWSCPGWMKTSGLMCGGSLREDCEKAFANYWAAYLQAYREAGVIIDAVTVQNEPLTDQKGGCPATLLTGAQEARLAGKYMPESFAEKGLDTRIWVYDHNPDPKHKDYINALLSSPDVQKSAEAIGWHPYSGSFEYMDSIHTKYPSFQMHLTERGPNLTDTDTQTEYWFANLIFSAMNHGCRSYTSWNLLLDPDGQPNTGKFACAGLLEYDMFSNTLTKSRQYTVFRHYSPYVKRGAEILSITQPDEELISIAFKNPDGSFVVCVGYDGNSKKTRKRVQIKHKGEFLTICLPMNTWSMTTIVITL